MAYFSKFEQLMQTSKTENKLSLKSNMLKSKSIVLSLALIVAVLSAAPARAAVTLSCSKTSNATANTVATSVSNTTFTLSISGNQIIKGSAYQCAGVATIPQEIQSIEFGAFVPWSLSNSPLSNPYLTSFVFPASGLTALNYAFINLSGISNIVIPSSVTSITSQALQGMSSLTSATIEGPTDSANTLTLPYYMFNEDRIALTIGNGYVNFGPYFDNGSKFTSVTLGPNVRIIGENAFQGQTDSQSFTNITFPSGLTTIGPGAFANNPYLKSISFGVTTPGLTSISANSFGTVSGIPATVLDSVQYCGLINPSYSNSVLNSYLFSNLPSTASIYCQTGTSPTVTNMSPATGLSAGGDTVTVQGANLSNAKVYFNGTNLAVSNNTSTSLQFSTPSGSAGTAQVMVVTNNGSVTKTFTYVNRLANPITVTSTPRVTNYVGETYTATATAPGGTVSITIDASAASKCSINGSNVVTFNDSGSCVINFNQTGNGTYAVASQSQQSITVSKYVITTRNVTIAAPVLGATPQASNSDNGQYSTSISWSGSPSTFAANTAYTATVTITPDATYTLTGVSANFFTINGGAPTSGNLVNAGSFTFTFPATAKTTITTRNISITAPVLGATPQTSIADNGQFSTGIVWSGSPSTFAANTVYTASVTVTPNATYSLTGVAANYFTVNGSAATVGNAANSGSFTFTFPAFWQISYLPNGGTGTQSSEYFQTGGTPVVLPLTSTFTAPTGKTFGGWATSSTSSTAVTTDYQTAAAITYYAIWTQTSHTVTFDINGGDGAQTMANQSVASPSTLTPNAYTYTGRYFLNWNTSADGTGTQYADQAIYQFLANVRLYAQWGRVITYSASGSESGSPSRSSDNWTSGAVTLPTRGTMIKAGYDFAGWTNGATTYTDTFTPTTIFALNPVWTAHTYTITFSKTGTATGSVPSNQTWTTGTSALTLSGNIGTPVLARTGYTFGGWATAGAPNTVVTSYSTFSDQNFIPIWAPVSYSVTYNLNGGNGTTPTQPILNINQSFNLATPTRSNFAFLGWLLDGSSNKYSAGYSFAIGATTATNLSFTAQWIAQYTVSYAMNGSTTVESSPTNVGLFDEGTVITLPDAPNLITGYNFSGWRDSNNVLHAASDTFTVIQNSVLSVQWTAISYTVTYSLGVVSGTPPTSSSATFNSTFSTPAAPSKPGYIFGNWNTSSDGSGTSYAGGQAYSVTSTGNITLTAQWTQIPYTVTYDLGGGTGTIPAALTNKHVGDSWSLPSSGSSPTWKAHTFLNWSDGSNSYAAGATYTLGAGSVTLTAMYQLNGTTSITYSFGSNPGSGTLPTQAAQMEGTVITLKSGAGLSRDGYTFGGWTDGSSAYKTGDTFVVPVYSNPVTFSPIWNSGYTVTYSAGIGSGTVPTDSAVRYNGDTFVVQAPSAPLVKDSFTFTGWSDGVNTYQSGSTYTVGNSSISLTAQWVQSSIYAAKGSPMTELDHKTIRSGVGYPNQSFTVGSSTISYNIPADAFGLATDNLDMYIYALSDASSFSSILPTNETYILPTIITWLAADGTVPVASSPITQTITSSQIKVGTIAYALTGTTYSILGTATQEGSMSISITADPVVVLGNPVVQPPVSTLPSSQPSSGSVSSVDSQAIAAAKIKAEADAKAAAELQAAQDKAKADAAAAELQAARDKAEADAKAANDAAALAKATSDAKAAAEAKALADAALAAELASKKITPDVTLYSISPKLTLSAFDLAYLKKYLSTLKKTATVTCIGYTYTQKLSLAKATVLAKKQATAVCAIVKKTRPTLKTAILIRPAKSAPKAAAGAQWVAISYRVDGYQLKK